MSEHFHFTAAQANLKRVLALAKDFVSKASMLPVLHSVMLEGKAGDAFLTLTATNLESVLRVRLAAKVISSGAMCATYTVLRDLVGTLPKDEQLEFKVEDGLRVQIITGGKAQETNLVLYDPAEYPMIPSAVYDDTSSHVDMDGKIVTRLGTEIAPLAASDLTRPSLTGVRVHFTHNQIDAVSTDGFRLARLTIPFAAYLENCIIIPAVSFAPLVKLIKLAAESRSVDIENVPVRLSIHGATSRIFWDLDDGYIATTLINGHYPDFEPIIPKSHHTRATVEAKTVHQRVQVVSVIALQAERSTIALETERTPEGQIFKMNASTTAVGDADGNMPAVVDGPDLKMAVDPRYLSQSLAIFNSREDDVVFQMRTAREPLMLTWRKDDSLFHLIMPMHQGSN